MATLKGTKAGDTLTASTTNYTILGFAGNDTITTVVSATGAPEAAYGGGGNDTLNGSTGRDRLYGDVGNDSLLGGGGQDSLYGGLGNDTLSVSGTGHSVLKGDQGNDLITGAQASTAADVTTFASNQTKWFTQYSYGGDGNDTIVGGVGVASDNHALWGGTGNDSITAATSGAAVNGINAQNHLYGELGNDTLTGSATVGVKDTMTGGLGADVITGGATGAANETTSYLLSSAAVQVNLALGTAQVSTGDASGDVITLVGNVTGSKFADTLTGTTGGNIINGGLGSDTIDAGGTSTNISAGTLNTGNDSVNGGESADRIFLHNGSQVYVAGVSGDTINGGNGSDTLDFSKVSGAVTADMSLGTFSGTAGGGSMISIEKLVGTDYNDTFTAVGGGTVSAGNGADTIFSATSGSGKDFLIGGQGADRFDLTATSTADYVQIGGTSLASAGIDSIFGFASTQGDKIQISLTDYSSLGLGAVAAIGSAGVANSTVDLGVGPTAGILNGTYNALGKLASYSLNVSDVIVGTAATGTHAQFFLDITTSATVNTLKYDADGAGVGAAVTVATFDTNTTPGPHGLTVLDSTDFIVVA